MSKEAVAEQPKNQLSLVVVSQNIASGLEAFENRKAELTTLKEEVEGLKIQSLEDKAGIKQVTEARKKLKAARVEIEKEGKSMRDPLTAVSKHISSKEKELVDIIEPTEKMLSAQEKWVKDEEARIAAEEIQKENDRINNRINRLSAYGYEIDFNMLKALSDADFDKMVESAKREFEKEEAAKAEKARQEQLQREQDEKDRAELKALREEQESRQRALKERQDELDRKERAIKEKEDKEAAKEREKAQAEEKGKISKRVGQLSAFGLKFNFLANQYEGFACAVHYFDITGYDDEKWDGMIENMGPHIEEYKRQEAEEGEAKRQQDLKEAAEKALAEEKARKEESERQEAERIAAASDRDKFAVITAHLELLPAPAMKSAKAKKLLTEVQELRDKIIAHIKAKA